jgi:hypothetical protein
MAEQQITKSYVVISFSNKNVNRMKRVAKVNIKAIFRRFLAVQMEK